MTTQIGVGGLTAAQNAARTVPGGILRSGQYIGLPVYSAPVKTTAIVADTMYAFPIPVAANCSLSGVAVHVGTAVAATLAKLGVALPGADGLPDRLLAEAPTPQDMNSLADTAMLAAFSTPVAAPAGFVWGLFVANGLAQPYTLAAFNFHSVALGQALGASTMGSLTLQGATGATIRVSRAHTYATAFPANLTGWSRAAANPSSPYMGALVS